MKTATISIRDPILVSHVEGVELFDDLLLARVVLSRQALLDGDELHVLVVLVDLVLDGIVLAGDHLEIVPREGAEAVFVLFGIEVVQCRTPHDMVELPGPEIEVAGLSPVLAVVGIGDERPGGDELLQQGLNGPVRNAEFLGEEMDLGHLGRMAGEVIGDDALPLEGGRLSHLVDGDAVVLADLHVDEAGVVLRLHRVHDPAGVLGDIWLIDDHSLTSITK